MTATTATTNKRYSAPIYANACSFSFRCAVCGADGEPGDIVKIYPAKLSEPIENPELQWPVRFMTKVIGVLRMVEGGYIPCHPDTRGQSTENPAQVQPKAAPVVQAAPSQATGQTPLELVQAQLAAMADVVASLATSQAPQTAATVPQGVRVPWDANQKPDGRNGYTKAFLARYPGTDLSKIKAEYKTGFITV
jgi:hypothetical protein